MMTSKSPTRTALARGVVLALMLCTSARAAFAQAPAAAPTAPTGPTDGPQVVPPNLGSDAPGTPVLPPSDPAARHLVLPPFFVEKNGPKGGYFHAPLLLTTSSWNADSAFTWAGPYWRTRKGTSIDSAVFPFYFHGSDKALGANKSYTLIPPLFFYTRANEELGTSLTWAGPYMRKEDETRRTTALFPFYYRISGKPEAKGVSESHTTVFPFVHYGRTKDSHLLVTPGVLSYRSLDAATLMTPLYSSFDNKKTGTHLTVAGPILPMFVHYTDKSVGLSGTGVFPFFYADSSPRHSEVWTPAFYHRKNYGENTFTWALPTFTLSTDKMGWAAALHPLVYAGKHGASKHVVVAPIYWRFSNSDEGTLTQVALNTVYSEKRVAGGTDWEFHLLPLFSYGENPRGHFWNVLFGLAGHTREETRSTTRVLWIPFRSDSAASATTTSR